MRRSTNYYYRKIHRYFGVIAGIQFAFWTLGGTFFVWSDMDQIHSDLNRNPGKKIIELQNWESPSELIANLSDEIKIDSILSLNVISLLDQPHYQIKYFNKGKSKTALVNAITGKLKAPLTKEEAEKIAMQVFSPPSEILKTEYLKPGMVGTHHEYRRRPLPAYAISFKHPSNTTVYVSTELGQVITLRNSNWRIFDFLWMMHTMDYKGRDNFGNILIKGFSILGMITIITGFILFFKTQKKRRKTNINI